MANRRIPTFRSSVDSHEMTQFYEGDEEHLRLSVLDMGGGSGSAEEKKHMAKIKEAKLTLIRTYIKLFNTADGNYSSVVQSDDAINKIANEIIAFGTALSNISLTPEEVNSAGDELYTKMNLTEIDADLPGFKWSEFIKTIVPDQNLQMDEQIVLRGKPYFKKLAKLLGETPKREVINYLFYNLLFYVRFHLPKAFRTAFFEYQKTSQGLMAEKSRWDVCSSAVNEKLPMALGAMYIRDNFQAGSKEIATEMIERIRAEFFNILEKTYWMGGDTKTVAKEKAKEIGAKIGYPDLLKDAEKLNALYEQMHFSRGTNLMNLVNATRVKSIKELTRLRDPVDKTKWQQQPAVVNAFYDPNQNSMIIPAGILQPMFYHRNSPKSLNYGGIGVVIGHEITHGFDDRGRKFNKDGNLADWWDNKTVEKFNENARCMVDQYSQYVFKDVNMSLNGNLTLGENIADNGGIKESFRAYRKWVTDQGQEEPLLPSVNLNHNQLFFLNFAQIWCGKRKPSASRKAAMQAVHPASEFRVQGTLSNSNDFAKAFNCKAGSPMNPVKKCSVWG